MSLDTFTAEVFPTEYGTFDPFLLDVPVLSLDSPNVERAARRAYWSVFSYLRLEPEQFNVTEYGGQMRQIGPGGFLPPVV